MTLEEAKGLVPEKDYVIYNGLPCRLLKLINSAVVQLEVSYGHAFTSLQNCQTLGSYLGSFSSDVLPPKANKHLNQSIDVIVLSEQYGMSIGFYDFVSSLWEFYGLNDTPLSFIWCFKPDYLKL